MPSQRTTRPRAAVSPHAERCASPRQADAEAAAYQAELAGILAELGGLARDSAPGLSDAHISTPGVLTYHEGARYARVALPPRRLETRAGGGEYGPEPVPGMAPHPVSGQYWHGAKRGKCRRFSHASRRRLLQQVASIDLHALGCRPLFITLTYPRVYSEDPAEWRRHLEAFRKALERRWGQVGTHWKLERQHRGAPHWHLIWYFLMPRAMLKAFRRWTSTTWYRVVGSGDERHLRAGTQVKYARSSKGVMAYAAKYAAKLGDDEGEWGRRWGVWNKKCLPIKPVVKRLAPSAFKLVRRVLRRLSGKRNVTITARERRRRKALRGPRGAPTGYMTAAWAFAAGADMERLLAWLARDFPSTGIGWQEWEPTPP